MWWGRGPGARRRGGSNYTEDPLGRLILFSTEHLGLWRREGSAIGFEPVVGLDGREAYPTVVYFLSL